jgi:hypothetical protein
MLISKGVYNQSIMCSSVVPAAAWREEGPCEHEVQAEAVVQLLDQQLSHPALAHTLALHTDDDAHRALQVVLLLVTLSHPPALELAVQPRLPHIDAHIDQRKHTGHIAAAYSEKQR